MNINEGRMWQAISHNITHMSGDFKVLSSIVNTVTTSLVQLLGVADRTNCNQNIGNKPIRLTEINSSQMAYIYYES